MEGVTYTWDYGDIRNPHLVKLVDKTPSRVSDICRPLPNTTYYGNIALPDPQRPLGLHKIMCPDPNPPGFFAGARTLPKPLSMPYLGPI